MGCAHDVTFTSEPPGAEVRLDGQNVGNTPLELPFQHYGIRRLTLYLDGYLTHSEVIEVAPPWYGRFPIDLFSEVVVPVGWEDVHRIDARLDPGRDTIPEPDLTSVLDRAELMRRAGPDGPRQIQQERRRSRGARTEP